MGHHEIICKDAKVNISENFSLIIKLNPEVCDRQNKSNIVINVNVFGQSASTLPITVGKIYCVLCGPLPLL